MSIIPFDTLPDEARLWIFGADRPLTHPEATHFLSNVDTFLADWAAHGAALTVGRDWRNDQFILVAVDERSVPPSGCSIDAFVRCLKDQEQELGLSLVDNSRIWYRVGAEIRAVSRAEFRVVAGKGLIDGETVVFDPALTRVGQLRSGEFERPARQGWHASLLPKHILEPG